MSTGQNRKKSKQLGMSVGTANYRLQRSILFCLVRRLGLNVCYQCQETIESQGNFSIEHKQRWLDSDNPTGLFFDLENIAFSHTKCNSAARRIHNHSMNAAEANALCKLTWGAVALIRERHINGETSREIAKDFPVSESQIGKIIRNERWVTPRVRW